MTIIEEEIGVTWRKKLHLGVQLWKKPLMLGLNSSSSSSSSSKRRSFCMLSGSIFGCRTGEESLRDLSIKYRMGEEYGVYVSMWCGGENAGRIRFALRRMLGSMFDIHILLAV